MGKVAAMVVWLGRPKALSAFQDAGDLVFKGLQQPAGYTEPLRHGWRLKVKAA